jgi:hypothetical protein
MREKLAAQLAELLLHCWLNGSPVSSRIIGAGRKQ